MFQTGELQKSSADSTMGFLCSGDPCKFIFQRFVFYLKIKVLTFSTTKQLIAEPIKAPTQLSEGWWFEPTHGF